MPEKRDYPPAVVVHRSDCADVLGRLLPQLPTAEIARLYPNGQRHHCYHHRRDPVGMVEQVEYPPHEYEKSTVIYPDATRALCGYCGGTHGVLDVLELPPAVRTVAPPRQE